MDGVKFPPNKFFEEYDILGFIQSIDPFGAWCASEAFGILFLSDINKLKLSDIEWVLFYCFFDIILELRF
jgi:hypothetical protein